MVILFSEELAAQEPLNPNDLLFKYKDIPEIQE